MSTHDTHDPNTSTEYRVPRVLPYSQGRIMSTNTTQHYTDLVDAQHSQYKMEPVADPQGVIAPSPRDGIWVGH